MKNKPGLTLSKDQPSVTHSFDPLSLGHGNRPPFHSLGSLDSADFHISHSIMPVLLEKMHSQGGEALTCLTACLGSYRVDGNGK